jgi:hypothetical protein
MRNTYHFINTLLTHFLTCCTYVHHLAGSAISYHSLSMAQKASQIIGTEGEGWTQVLALYTLYDTRTTQYRNSIFLTCGIVLFC